MIKKLHEVIIYVADMQTEVRFYRDVLGFTVTNMPGDADFSNAYWVELDTGGAQLVLHGGGSTEHKNAPTLAFLVDDIVATRNELIERGATLGEIRYPVAGSEVSDGLDPEGNRFCIFTRTGL